MAAKALPLGLLGALAPVDRLVERAHPAGQAGQGRQRRHRVRAAVRDTACGLEERRERLRSCRRAPGPAAQAPAASLTCPRAPGSAGGPGRGCRHRARPASRPPRAGQAAPRQPGRAGETLRRVARRGPSGRSEPRPFPRAACRRRGQAAGRPPRRPPAHPAWRTRRAAWGRARSRSRRARRRAAARRQSNASRASASSPSASGRASPMPSDTRHRLPGQRTLSHGKPALRTNDGTAARFWPNGARCT